MDILSRGVHEIWMEVKNMNDYGIGGAVLGMATVLPATAAVGLWFADKTNILIIFGFLAILTLSLVMNVAIVMRFFKNYKK